MHLKKIKNSRLTLAVVTNLMFVSCFGGIDTTGSVKAYRQGRVKTVGGEFQLSDPGKGWQSVSSIRRIVLFSHKESKASLGVSSWCRSAFDDAPYQVLAEQLFQGLDQTKILDKKSFRLDGRKAFETTAHSSLDGENVIIKTVILKKNQCVYDFLLVQSGQDFSADVLNGWSQVLDSFHTEKSPPIL